MLGHILKKSPNVRSSNADWQISNFVLFVISVLRHANIRVFKIVMTFNNLIWHCLVVRILGSHPRGPGSIPCAGNFLPALPRTLIVPPA